MDSDDVDSILHEAIEVDQLILSNVELLEFPLGEKEASQRLKESIERLRELVFRNGELLHTARRKLAQQRLQ